LQHFRAPEGLAPGPGYSHAVTGRGRWVAISGQIALDENGDLVGPGDLEAQAWQVFANLNRALTAAGASFADVIELRQRRQPRDRVTQFPCVRRSARVICGAVARV
jgi:enamine deaminase RidA (YjgF/YER057c/UK114 family)